MKTMTQTKQRSKVLLKCSIQNSTLTWEEARFLGRGTVTVSQIFYTSPSRCAVADSCAVSLDRRMTFGETWESCLDEIRALPSVQKYGDDVVVSMYNYDRPSYTGCKYEIECYFPTWAIPKDHKVTKALEDAYKTCTVKPVLEMLKQKKCEKHAPYR